MREIKFRQWDIQRKRYYYNIGITGPGEWCGPPYTTWSHYPLEQFTGIYDKNDKEIYEGDIVHVTDGNERDDVCDTGIGVVVFLESAGLWYIDGKINNSLFDIHQEMYIEVIGNIHETVEKE